MLKSTEEITELCTSAEQSFIPPLHPYTDMNTTHAHSPKLQRVDKGSNGLLGEDQVSVVGWQKQDAYITYDGGEEGDEVLYTCIQNQ